MTNTSTVLVMAKAPQPGRAKTRLAVTIGDAAAATIARQLLDHTISQVVGCAATRIEYRLTPGPDHPAWHNIDFPAGDLVDQGDGDLGSRMWHAVTSALTTSDIAILIGTDCPDLTTTALNTIISTFDDSTCDAVIVPALDGGYVALGLKHPDATIFHDMPWSTGRVCQLTHDRLTAIGRQVSVLPALPDIDTAADLHHLPWPTRH